MVVSIVTWGRTLLMRVKLLIMCFGLVGRDMNGERDHVKRRGALELEEFSWLDLPTDVVQSITLMLSIEDTARLECVCKSWRDIIQTAPRFYPVGKSPLLLHVKSRGEERGKGAVLHYHSPLLNKAFQMGCPLDLIGYEISPLDLIGYEIISAIHGKLLIYNPDEMKMRMVDPLLGRSKDFTDITSNISFNGTAIGVHGKYYIIFLIDTSHENQTTMHYYFKGRWYLNLVYYRGENDPFYISSNPVPCDDRFYCLNNKGDRVGVFDVMERTWNVYPMKNKYHDDDDDDIHSCCCYYLVEWIDTVMAVRVENFGSGIHLFLLDREKMVWKETDDLGGRSLFLGSTLSAMSLPTAKKLRNRVFLPHYHQDETKTAIISKLTFCCRRFYFRSRSFISSKEKNHAATSICCCNNSGEESEYLGSIKNQKYSTIWFRPYYMGITAD